jgi:ribosome-associated protein
MWGPFNMGGTTMTDDLGTRIQINRKLAIPLSELRFQFSRSGGPGGQNVNRRETRVELLFDVRQSPSLSEGQRARLLQRLTRYLDADGILRIVVTSERSQLRNRQQALARFVHVLQQGLRVPRRRLPTQPSARARARRLEQKRQRSAVKAERRPVRPDEWQ